MNSLLRLVAAIVVAATFAVPAALAGGGTRPDDRSAGPRSDVLTVPISAVRPDDRSGYRGPQIVTTQTPGAVGTRASFNFADAGIGAAAAAGALVVLAGITTLILRRRARLAV